MNSVPLTAATTFAFSSVCFFFYAYSEFRQNLSLSPIPVVWVLLHVHLAELGLLLVEKLLLSVRHGLPAGSYKIKMSKLIYKYS